MGLIVRKRNSLFGLNNVLQVVREASGWIKFAQTTTSRLLICGDMLSAEGIQGSYNSPSFFALVAWTNKETDERLQHCPPTVGWGGVIRSTAYYHIPLCFCRQFLTDVRPKLVQPWRRQSVAETQKTSDTAVCILTIGNDENLAEGSASVPDIFIQASMKHHHTDVLYICYLTFSYQLYHLGPHLLMQRTVM